MYGCFDNATVLTMRKTCFKCHTEKPITDFYKHPAMGDGHLGKCIECTKADTAERERRKRLDPEWVMMERARCREKQIRRYNAMTPEERLELSRKARATSKAWDKVNRYKKRAHLKLRRAIRSGAVTKPSLCSECGAGDTEIHGHHEDYSNPLEVVWLCGPCHGVRHRKPKPDLSEVTP